LYTSLPREEVLASVPMPLTRENARVVRGDQLNRAVGLLRSYGAVAILGAGLSAPRYPMTAELASLLWHSFDAHPAARAALAKQLGKDNAEAKNLIDEDPVAVEAAWLAVKANPAVRVTLQSAFARLDADREPTPAHYGIARLIHEGLVEYVVSFNWDTALERAHEQLFGTSIAGRHELLDKPHGDAANPNEPWVFPHETGVVPNRILDRVAELAGQRPRVLLIVGYSGSDEAVVQQLLAPTEGRWPVVRNGPRVQGGEGLMGYADDILPALADALGAKIDLIGWRWVTFTRRRDLRAALLGYRLGPQDVEACPRFPAADTIADRLRHASFAVIVGDSGAGKSITAFQAAHTLNREGWAVVELSQTGVATGETIRAFQALRGPVLAVIDDAQALAPDVIRAFERSASNDHAVLIVATERQPDHEQVRLHAAHAVAALIRFFDAHSDAVEPLVQEVDDRVGYGMTREPFPRRLDAARDAQFPWQFMYVLSGGERRISTSLANLAGAEAADLLFGILAAGQLLSLDAGVTRERLDHAADLVGQSPAWVGNALAQLANQRLVLRRGDYLRTPHMRIADRGLLVMCRDHSNPSWQLLISFLRAQLLDPDLPLQGKFWLLRAIDQADPLRYGAPGRLLDEDVAWFLIGACIDASAGRERNIAAYLLWEIGWWKALTEPMAERIAENLPPWLREASSEDAYGLQWLLGGLRSDFPTIHGIVSRTVDPADIAHRLAEYGTPETGEEWGRVIAELANAESVDRQTWGARFQEAAAIDRLKGWIASAPPTSRLYGIVHLSADLAFLSPMVAAEIIEAVTPALAERIATQPAAASYDLIPWAFSIFPLFASEQDEVRETEPGHNRVLEAVEALVANTDWDAAGRNLTQVALHELDQIDLLTYSVHAVSPNAEQRMTTAISIDYLDRITEGHWTDFAGIEHLVVALSHGPERQPARAWVDRHRNEIERMPTQVVPIAPTVAVEVVQSGGQIDLAIQKGLRWAACADAITALAIVDREAALVVVRASMGAIVEGLALTQTNTVEHLPDFIEALDAIDPRLLEELLNDVDPDTAKRNWAERLAGKTDEAAAANILINRALQAGPAISEAAHALRQEQSK
jgi:hypothetical protein